jgi:hypothetical protein
VTTSHHARQNPHRETPPELTMSQRTIDALHDVHTATNDVLKGYREMSARAEPEIEPVIRRLTEMHQRHAAEHTAALSRVREAGQDDSSMQGTMNKVVIILRDWVSDLDRDALPAVRSGEESLRDEFDKALGDVSADATVHALLTTQRGEIDREIARLPQDSKG